MTRSRTRTFRRSVIQVAAAFAVLPACGRDISGTAREPKCGDDDARGCMPEVECDDTVDSCNPPNWTDHGTCPSEAPSAGESCEGDRLCSYDPCSNAANVSSATCEGGLWQVGSASCNPPPPPEESCPEAPPAQGAGCADLTLDCGYDPCTNERGVIGARCVDHAWQVDEDYSCNPPPPEPECPEELPELGAPCDEAGMSCNYGDGHYEAECSDQLIWEVRCIQDAEECVLPGKQCPVEPPTQGESCTHTGPSCGYYDCEGTPSLTADCVNGSWSLSEVSCNPPPIDVGED
jgi:hypothetical protein